MNLFTIVRVRVRARSESKLSAADIAYISPSRAREWFLSTHLMDMMVTTVHPAIIAEMRATNHHHRARGTMHNQPSKHRARTTQNTTVRV